MQYGNPAALAELWASWPRSKSNGYANAAVWDASADEFKDFPVPSWDEDPFLEMIAQEASLGPETTVLDIGSGSGVYSIAFSDRVKRVTGIDVSKTMVKYAHEKVETVGCRNIEFLCDDFRTAHFDEPYDVVIAHLTPAVADGETFQKMMGLTRHYCAIAKPVRRTDSILDELRRILGAEPGGKRMDDEFLRAFSAVWLSGKIPTVRSYPDVWRNSRSLDTALEIYGNRLIAMDLDDDQRSRIADYLASVAEDGVVTERIDTTVMMMGWGM